MAATFYWCEDNGSAAGTPPSGSSRSFNVSNVNWKAVDDTSTAYTSSPVRAGQNSMPKYQFGMFSGAFNEISNVKFNHTTGSLDGTNCTISGAITSGYLTPDTGVGPTEFSFSGIGLSSTGFTVLLGPQPAMAGTSSETTSPCYTEYIVSQLVTTTGASAGDLTNSIRFTIEYDEA